MAIFLFLIISLAVALYFLPTIVAICRNHPNKMPIFIINLFLSFTLLGWVISLAWACAHIKNEGIVKNEELRKLNEKIEKLQAAYLPKSDGVL